MDDKDMERRLQALEMALAHHQAEMQDLSDVIAGQWQAIDLLVGRVERAEALIRQLLAEPSGDGSEAGPD